MVDFVGAAGWAIWPVLLFGGVSVLAAASYAWTPLRERLSLVVGGSIGTLLIGCLGAIAGVQKSVAPLGEVPHEGQWIFLLGLQEALNGIVAAFVLVCIATVLATVGSYRRARDESLEEATAS